MCVLRWLAPQLAPFFRTRSGKQALQAATYVAEARIPAQRAVEPSPVSVDDAGQVRMSERPHFGSLEELKAWPKLKLLEALTSVQ